ncbi:hypothetical protein SEA_FORZA_44 [Gordonia phage Forza]|uniref:Uncharacterized protein n=1 Tax=Gordonia phage Forza TaxID=2571247 RepID=A0A650EXZ4_9CAUD|nr:hypothetical protein PP303_gp044 [Gordonia phage Forza]QEM41514.1 hypothetical protein SEA_BOOPY_45 [Gordonia phage Boopy]QGT55037.1 hypothetical protein SEA_FORZA_44 [Gordonia phage Forza]UXE04187.1 hypothetical protein SEA_BLUENGOLD_43 [Gordonia phage BlueNGold]
MKTMNKIAATVFIAAGIFGAGAGFVGAADADPCRMPVGNGQFAPCPPPIVSTDNGPANRDPQPRDPETFRIHLHVDSDGDGEKDNWVVQEGTSMRDAIDTYEANN